jgi:16S rRNA processing protein RimM
MAYSCNILLGRITKASGYEGAVTIKLERSFIENIPQMESVFLEIDGRPVPFFISETDYSGSDILRLKFTDYDTADKVNEFKGCKVFLTTTGDNNNHPDSSPEITGFGVFTEKDVLIGSIKEIIKNPGQWLLNITTPDNKEILIPLHEDLIIDLNENKKLLVMKVPDGLTELN